MPFSPSHQDPPISSGAVSDFVRSAPARVAMVAVLLLLGSTLALSWRHERAQAMTRLDHRLAVAVAEPVSILEETITQASEQVRFLSEVPPIRGLQRAAANAGFDAQGGNTSAVWRERLGQIFAAVLRTSPGVAQIRYIGVADGGRELVRVERAGSEIHVVEVDQLQRKAHRQYVVDALAMEGKTYVSDVTLNREHGQLEVPWVPPLRVGVAVKDEAGELFGLVVMNLDLRQRLETLGRGLPEGLELYMTNTQGDFLVHPHSWRTFGFETGSPYRWNDAFSSVQGAWQSVDSEGDGATAETFRGSSRTVELGEREGTRGLRVTVLGSEDEVSSSIAARVATSVFELTILSTAGLFGLFLYWARVQSRLQTGLERSRLAAIVDGSLDAIVGISDEGMVESWNRGAEHVFGYSAAEAIGIGFAALTATPESPKAGLAAWTQEVLAHEARLRCRDVRVIDVSMTGSQIRAPSACTAHRDQSYRPS